MPQSFTLFPHLPAELRLEIWKQLLPPPTVLRLTLAPSLTLTPQASLQIPRRAPALLHINHETRALAQSTLTAVLAPLSYIDLCKDTLYISPTAGRAITSRSSLESLLRDADGEAEVGGRGGSVVLSRLRNLAVHFDNWDNLIEVAPAELVGSVFSSLQRVVVVVDVMDGPWVDGRGGLDDDEGEIDIVPLRGEAEHVGFVSATVQAGLEDVQGVEVVLMSGKRRGLGS